MIIHMQKPNIAVMRKQRDITEMKCGHMHHNSSAAFTSL